MKQSLRILHTSDWHLGRRLFGHARTEEFSMFLTWLLDTIREQRIDVLLVSGDIFDTTVPGSTAQNLYFSFLGNIAKTACKHVVITSGNHDSASLLGASSLLLGQLNIHIVTKPQAEEETLVLTNDDGTPVLGVIAIPFLQERDIRVSQQFQTLEEQEQAYQAGIREHFELAQKRMQEKLQDPEIPVVCMAHLFTVGGSVAPQDGVKELAVGSLVHVPPSIFPTNASYVALGHLHVPQKIAQSETIRYSGSPLPMGFGEAKQTKLVCIIDYDETGSLTVHQHSVPIFRKLHQITGDLAHIEGSLAALTNETTLPSWLEIIYDGKEHVPSVQQRIEDLVSRLTIDHEVLAIRDQRIVIDMLQVQNEAQPLESMTVHQVFEKCLELNGIEPTQSLSMAFDQIVYDVEHPDVLEEL